MTIHARLLCAVAAVAALAATAPAQALTQQECGAKYQAAKAANTLNGQKYNDFRKAECGADATAAPAAAAKDAAAPKEPAKDAAKEPAKDAAPKEAAAKKKTAAAPAAPVETGNAVFPTAVDPKFAKETPHLARMHTCSAQWQANKTANTTGGMQWSPKGGGYYSECNKRLKG